MKYLLFLASLFAIIPALADVWSPFIEGQARYGDYKEGVGLDGFVPVYQGAQGLAFVQGRVYAIRYQQTVGIGLGGRRFFGPRIAGGLNAFIDYAHTTGQQNYVQGTFGAELFGPFWEGRINGYWASNQQSLLSSATHCNGKPLFRPNSLELLEAYHKVERFEFVYSGFDGEIGIILPCLCGYVRGYTGGFYWTTKNNPNMAGPRLRARYERDFFWGSRFAWRLFGGVDWQYDQVRKTQAAVYGGIRLCGRSAKDRCAASSICRRMGDLVHREPINIVREQRECHYMLPYGGLEGAVRIWFIQQDGRGVGTQLNPTNIQEAQLRSHPGDTLVVLADNGPITYATQGIDTLVLQERQHLVGFGGDKAISVSVGETLVTIEAIGSRGQATLQGVVDRDMIRAATDTHVARIALQEGLNGISGSHVEDVSIHDVSFEQQECSALHFTHSTNIGGDAVSVHHTHGPAVTFIDPSGLYPFTNSTWVGNGGGMEVVDGSATISIEDSVIATIDHTLLQVTGGSNEIHWLRTRGGNDYGRGVVVQETTGGAISLEGIVITNPIDSAVTLTNNSCDFAYRNGVISHASDVAVAICKGSGDITFDGTAITQQNHPLIAIQSTTGGNIRFLNGLLTQEGGQYALEADHAIANVRIDNLTASNFTANPVVVSDSIGSYTLSNVKVRGVPKVENTGIAVTNHSGDFAIIDGGEASGFTTAVAFCGEGDLAIAGSSAEYPFILAGEACQLRADMHGYDLVLDYIDQPTPSKTALSDYLVVNVGNLDVTNTSYTIDSDVIVGFIGFEATSCASGSYRWNFDQSTLTSRKAGGYYYKLKQLGDAQVRCSLCRHLGKAVGKAPIPGLQVDTQSTKQPMSLCVRDTTLSGGGERFAARFAHYQGNLHLTIDNTQLSNGGPLSVVNEEGAKMRLHERNNQASAYTITNYASYDKFTLIGLSSGYLDAGKPPVKGLQALGNRSHEGSSAINVSLCGSITTAPCPAVPSTYVWGIPVGRFHVP